MKILLSGLTFVWAYSMYTMELANLQNHKNRFTSYKHELKQRKKKIIKCLKTKDFTEFKKNLGNINVMQLTNSRKIPFLHKAVQEGLLIFAEFLLEEKKASVNQLDEEGQTPLFYAFKFKPKIQLLASHGARPNHQANDGNTVLHKIIIEKGRLFHLEVIVETQYTSDIKIDPLIRNKEGFTPLGLAYRSKASQDILNFLEHLTLKKFTRNHVLQNTGCAICTVPARKFSNEQRCLTLCCTHFLCSTCMQSYYDKFPICGYCGYRKGIKIKKTNLNLE